MSDNKAERYFVVLVSCTCMLIIIKLTRRTINYPPPETYFTTDDEMEGRNQNDVFNNRSKIFVHASYIIDRYAQR